MPYPRYAHFNSIEAGLKVGMKVKRGDLLGEVGTTGNSTAPHIHIDIFKNRPQKWGEYVWALSKDQVQERYVDPYKYVSASEEIPMKWNSIGNDWLDPITNSDGRKGFHPGLDLNWGSGWDDFKFPANSIVNGEIAYIGKDGRSGGWGNFMVIKELIDLGYMYDNHYIQETEDSGSFALVYKGKKHFVLDDRAGLAALTVLARDMTYSDVTKDEWDKIPSGDNF